MQVEDIDIIKRQGILNIMKKVQELEFVSVKKFIKAVGEDANRYFGKDPSCIIYLLPHGVFYATGLFEWLQQKKKNVLITSMEDDGGDLQKEKVRGRKVLIVDGDIITGKAYKRSMEALRLQREALKIKDVKFATYVDRAGLADFAVWKYNAEATWQGAELDAMDLKIVSLLKGDGRISFTTIGKQLRISGVAVKNRVDWLLKKKIVEIQGALVMDKFYSLSAEIQIDGDPKAVAQLIDILEKKQEVYHLVKRTGSYTLGVGFLARVLEDVENLVEKEIRTVEGVRNIDVRIGELPIFPKIFSPQF